MSYSLFSPFFYYRSRSRKIEGLAISMPLRREGLTRLKSFWYGQLSGIVEPMAGVIGAAAVLISKPILPYALSFAAGAMIFVVVEELIPESQRGGNTDIATMGAILGFAVMMVLDVGLGGETSFFYAAIPKKLDKYFYMC